MQDFISSNAGIQLRVNFQNYHAQIIL
jgi:hypothetical protein